MKTYPAEFSCFFLLFYILWPAVFLTAQSNEMEPLLRVRIIDNADSIKMHFNDTWSIAHSDNQLTEKDSIITVTIHDSQLTFSIDKQIIYSSSNEAVLHSNSGTVKILDVPYGLGWWWEGKEDRIYEGAIHILKTNDNKINVVVHLPMERYLKGVVPYEMGGDSPLEALKAQAIAARSEAVMALRSGLYSGPYHDLSADVECQVFSGNHKRTSLSDEAVAMTAGVIITEKDQPIHAYYASNCGGHSERIENVWPERPAPQTYRLAQSDSKERRILNLSNEDSVALWIRSQPQVYCNPYLETELPPWSRKNFRWQRTEQVDDLTKKLARDKDDGLLMAIKALKRGPSGRIYQARFIFEKDSFEVNGELNIRRLWQPALRSSCFIIEKTDTAFTLLGAGWGHGVGMCQSGAIAQARQGMEYYEILKYYYPLAQLRTFYTEEYKRK